MSARTELPWHVVEEAINREISWLRKVIVQNNVEKIPGCDECQYTFRKIALLIITGQVYAKELTAKTGHDLWDGLTQQHSIAKSAWHGGDWHRKMMDIITTYFERDGFDVIQEPYISKGRADLGIYKDGCLDLFIEIGTTSVYKLWWNLQMLTDCKILLVTDENRAIEFTCHDTHGDRLHRP